MWKKIVSIIGAVVLLGSVISGYVWFDSRYAKASDTEKNAIEIKINGLKDDIRWYQDQMSYIMSRCGKRDPKELPDHAYKNYIDYEQRKQALDKQLEALMRKK